MLTMGKFLDTESQVVPVTYVIAAISITLMILGVLPTVAWVLYGLALVIAGMSIYRLYYVLFLKNVDWKQVRRNLLRQDRKDHR